MHISSAIKADPRALQEYDCMRKDCVLEMLHKVDASDSSLTITLLNARSLHKHAIYIYNDQVLLNTDVLCNTETQVSPHQNTNNISEVLTNFNYLHNKCEDTFQSISFCYKSHVEIIDYYHSVGISIVNF